MSVRTWLFRIIVVAVAGLIITSFLSPWWVLNVHIDPTQGALEQPPDVVRIYAYGFRSELTQNEYLAEPFITPHYQAVVAFVFLGVSVALILFSTWLKGKKGQWLLGLSGLIYTGYAVGCLIMLSNGVKKAGYPLQGMVYFQSSLITTSFKPVYYAMFIAGAALVLLALLRNIIAPALRAEKKKA
jgi:hypothetical protein